MLEEEPKGGVSRFWGALSLCLSFSSLFSSCLLGGTLSCLEDVVSFFFLRKTEL